VDIIRNGNKNENENENERVEEMSERKMGKIEGFKIKRGLLGLSGV
jgi:hypothetical protein